MVIKVCGMRLGSNIREVEALGVDWIGLIFYPLSPRYVATMPDYLPLKAKRVGVFVDESTTTICQRATDFGLHLVQLHGNESPAQCLELKAAMPNIGIIKALGIENAESLHRTGPYEQCGAVDYFLFDTYCSTKGGSGHTFNHHLLQHYRGHTPFLLSGGLTPNSSLPTHPMLVGYDLNSRFETAPAVKDPQLIKQFLTLNP